MFALVGGNDRSVGGGGSIGWCWRSDHAVLQHQLMCGHDPPHSLVFCSDSLVVSSYVLVLLTYVCVLCPRSLVFGDYPLCD